MTVRSSPGAKPGAGITRVFAELSAPGVSFGTPRLLERYADPGGLTPPPPRLVRLISESVMLAWTGVESGHWVVRTAAIDLNGVRAIDTISSSGRNALLTDLIPGPAGEAYALWSEPQSTSSGGLDLHDRALYAARGIDAYPGRTIFGAPERSWRRAHPVRPAKPPSASIPTPTARSPPGGLPAARSTTRCAQSAPVDRTDGPPNLEHLLVDQKQIQRDDQPGQRERRRRSWCDG